MWEPFRRELLVACLVIGFIWLFLIIFIGVTVGTQTHGTRHYMTPVGVSEFLQRGIYRVYVVATVLVLDRQRIRCRALCRRIRLDVDRPRRISNDLYTIVFRSSRDPQSQ
jgi:hypothetical protein